MHLELLTRSLTFARDDFDNDISVNWLAARRRKRIKMDG